MNSTTEIDRVNDPPDVGLSDLEKRLEGKGWLRRQVILFFEGFKFWRYGPDHWAAWSASSWVSNAMWGTFVATGLTFKQLFALAGTAIKAVFVTIFALVSNAIP